MKYGTYLILRRSYRSGLKQAQLTLGQRHYETIKTTAGLGINTPSDDEPKYGIRDATAGNFHLKLGVDTYTSLLENLELEAEYGFEYERSGSPLINKLLPPLSGDQGDIRRSDFKRYSNYPRKTAIGTAISFVIFAIASLVTFPFLSYISLSGVFVKMGSLSSSIPLQIQGAFGMFLVVFSLFYIYTTIKNHSKKARWRLHSLWLKRYFLGARPLHWGRKLQIIAVFSIVSYWNLWWAPWMLPGRIVFATLFLAINQRQFKKTQDETEAFVAAWRFGLTFITIFEICMSIVGVLAGVFLIVVQ